MNKEYQDYLKSPEWQGKRQLFYARAGHRCQLCNAEGEIHAHHRTYERVGNEHPDDVTVLCADCHAKFHGIEPRKAVPINCVSHVFKELWGFISLMEEKGARIVPSPDGGLQLMVDGEIRTTFNHYGMEAWISLCAKLISVSMEFDMFYQHLCDEGFENTAEAAAQDNLEVIEERCEARRTEREDLEVEAMEENRARDAAEFIGKAKKLKGGFHFRSAIGEHIERMKDE